MAKKQELQQQILAPYKEVKEEDLKALVKEYENVIEVVDTDTYNQAKLARRLLRESRTYIGKIQKGIKSTLNDLKSQVDDRAATLISITEEKEKEWDAEVKKWEDKKEQEKQDKLRMERERVEKIQKAINNTCQDLKSTIAGCKTIEELENQQKAWETMEFDEETYQEQLGLLTSNISQILASEVQLKKAALEKEELLKKQQEENEQLRKQLEEMKSKEPEIPSGPGNKEPVKKNAGGPTDYDEWIIEHLETFADNILPDEESIPKFDKGTPEFILVETTCAKIREAHSYLLNEIQNLKAVESN